MFVLVKVLWPLLLIGLCILYFCCLYILGLFCWFVLFGLLTDLCCVILLCWWVRWVFVVNYFTLVF